MRHGGSKAKSLTVVIVCVCVYVYVEYIQKVGVVLTSFRRLNSGFLHWEKGRNTIDFHTCTQRTQTTF